MNILVIAQYYAPDITAAAFRITETVEHLRSSGHELKVITAIPHKSSISLDQDDIYEDDPYVIRVEISELKGGGVRNYLGHYFSFVMNAIKAGISLIKNGWKPDVIWVTSPPLFVGVIGYVLSKYCSCKYVLDVRDIWPESAVAAGQIREPSVPFKIGKKLEKMLYQSSAHITCVSKPMASYISGLTDVPVTVVYNAVDVDAARYAGSIEGVPTNMYITYAGNVGRVQGLDLLINGFAELKKEGMLSGWKVQIIGEGVLLDEIKATIKTLGLQKDVIIMGAMEKKRALEELSRSAILFFNLQADRVFSLTIPSKLFDYLMVNRPIVAGVVGEGKSILLESKGNEVFLSNDTGSFKDKLMKVVGDITGYQEKAELNYQVVEKGYTRRAMTNRLLTVLVKVVE